MKSILSQSRVGTNHDPGQKIISELFRHQADTHAIHRAKAHRPPQARRRQPTSTKYNLLVILAYTNDI